LGQVAYPGSEIPIKENLSMKLRHGIDKMNNNFLLPIITASTEFE
jgi:hypothetical protein